MANADAPIPAAGESSPDVLVIGGGVIGASIAFELAGRGLSVTLLERAPELGRGCSGGNLGLLCPGHSTPLATPESLKLGFRYLLDPAGPLYLRPRARLLPWLTRYVASCRPSHAERNVRAMRELSTMSLARHAALAKEGHETTFEQRGILTVCETDAGLESLHSEADANQRAGLNVEVLDGREARQLEPALAPHVCGAAFYRDEAHCDGHRFLMAMAQAAESRGARLRTSVEVVALHRRNGRIDAVETTEGMLRSGSVVLAAGAWTARLAATASVFVPVEGGKGYHVELALRGGEPQIPALFVESRIAATPLAGRIRLGGTLELAGLDLTVRQPRVDAIVRAAYRAFPGLAGREPTSVWRGLRPCSPDGVPIIGRAADVENLILATGHTHMGLALAPVTGQLVAELLGGDQPSYDLDPIAPTRFKPLVG